MSPINHIKSSVQELWSKRALVTKPTDPDALVLDAWSAGFMTGALVIMACITIANMRRHILLHKLILLELVLSLVRGFTVFSNPPVYGWFHSSAGTLLYICYALHNVIAWMKVKPFLSQKISRFYIVTVVLAQPFWVLQVYANFCYFSNKNKLFERTRPIEVIFRDPWWIFTVVNLFWNIKTRYEFTVVEILRISPRLAIMLTAMILSIIFVIVDLLSVINIVKSALPTGINPWWRLSYVFKCLTDSVILDDFKITLDRLSEYRQKREGSLGPLDYPASNTDHLHSRDREFTHPVPTSKTRTMHVEDIERLELQRQLPLRDALDLPIIDGQAEITRKDP